MSKIFVITAVMEIQISGFLDLFCFVLFLSKILDKDVYMCPSVLTGILAPGAPQVPKSTDAQVP